MSVSTRTQPVFKRWALRLFPIFYFSNKVAIALNIHFIHLHSASICKKNYFNLYLTPYARINLKWAIDLNVKLKPIKYPDKK